MKEVIGNLVEMGLQGKFDIIIQGCNCFNTMGAGLAKEIKEKIPEAYEADQKTKKGDIRKLGDFSYAILDNGLAVINCYTQYRYGRNHEDGDKFPVDYEAITLCLRKINKILPGKSIGVPLIGCGLAGGDWNIVSKIVEKELKDLDVTIVKFE